MVTRTFLAVKIRALAARARRLARIDPESVGIRPQDRLYAPSTAHFRAANRRLATIDAEVERRLSHLQETWRSVPMQRVLIDIALVEREIDRARRAFGLFFEIFSQRGSMFAPALAAHDVIAADCYRAVREAAPYIFRGPLLKPLCYMEHGFSPATMRRGVQLNRLLGEPNPFPIVRIPWDRDNPWQAVFLHEVAHNLQADLGIWQENRQAVIRRLLRSSGDPGITRIYGRWHKEIFADLAAILLGGPSAAFGMANFLAHPAPRTLTYRPGGAHPTAYLRIHILAEMLRRLGFRKDGELLRAIWKRLYDPRRFHRLPVRLLATSEQLIPHVVDEIAFQTRRNLAQRALVDVIPFRPEDERAIRDGVRVLVQGSVPQDLAPRHLVSAASYALAQGRIAPDTLATRVIRHLTESSRGGSASLTRVPQAA
ncbi:hypothetical protein [Methylocaldum szegediense]|uniref:Uncharacterized protein n=1 Tax=Methylocaldum szegediense TaxID=73780 RepID=A0ABN8WY53_9GAMM|nr:hypothetical protein [Methylocaldum szegediense]CAI8756328.1 conserved protein of unknown function [Methylocaldum szegediense]